METPPDSLYKYRSFDQALRVIGTQSLWWPSPLSFNDPFDCQWDPAFLVGTSELLDQVWKLVKELLLGDRSEWDRLNHREGANFRKFAMQRSLEELSAQPESQQTAWLESKRDFFIRIFLSDLTAYQQLQLAQVFLQGVQVMCASASEKSVLMWSHYADSHQGIVLEFDSKLLHVGGHPYELLKVDYKKELPHVFQTEGLAERIVFEDAPLIQRPGPHPVWVFVSTKALHWAYEEEWRAVLSIRPADGRAEPHQFQAGAIKSVILGCDFIRRHGEAGLDQLNWAIRSLPGTVPRLRIAKKSRHKFEVEIEDFAAK